MSATLQNKTTNQAKTQRNIKITVTIILTVMAVLVLAVFQRILEPRVLSKEELLLNNAVIFSKPRLVKEFKLVNEQGEVVEKKDLQDQWTLLFFGFTHCPDICPMTLFQLNQVVEKLDPDIREQVEVGMVSLDPARDTQEKLQQYVKSFNPDFFALSGEFLDILKFSRNVNVAFSKVPLKAPSDNRANAVGEAARDKEEVESAAGANPAADDNYTIDHTGNIVLLNPYGDYHGFFKPPFELAKLKLTLSSVVQQGVPGR